MFYFTTFSADLLCNTSGLFHLVLMFYDITFIRGLHLTLNIVLGALLHLVIGYLLCSTVKSAVAIN